MFGVLNSPEYVNFFGALGGMGDAVGGVIGASALLYSMIVYKESLMLSHYSELDATYAGLLEKCIEHPHFVSEDAERDPTEKIQYDMYAFMVWNFIETIVDRCQNNKPLSETWSPIIAVEAKKHYGWFIKPENKDKFKESFRNHIHDLMKHHSSSNADARLKKVS
jgi:hypothetical protein